MLRQLIALTFCLVGVGCSALNIQRPTAAVRGMSIGSLDSAGFTMNFDVELSNPNSIALPLKQADYKLGLGGVNVVQGKATPEGAIPAGGSTAVQVPVTLTYENLLAARDAILKSGGNVPYDFDAGVSFAQSTGLFGDVRVPLKFQGTLPIKDLLSNPQALLQSKAARRLAQELMTGLFGR